MLLVTFYFLDQYLHDICFMLIILFVTCYTPNFYGTHLQYMSRYFNLWRGGIKFHISVICSQFHACRFKVIYVPYNLTVPTLQQSDNCVSVVLDVTKETEFSFTIPYMQNTEWRNLNRTGWLDVPAQTDTNGQIFIELLNKLTSGQTSVTPIYFQVFASAADDFQFAVPSLENQQLVGMPSTQMGTRKIFDINDWSKYRTQMNTSSCQLPSSSMECLMQQKYPVLGGIESGHITSRNQTSLEITGIRQLMNMSTLISVSAVSSSTAINFNTVNNFNFDINSTSVGYNNSYLFHMACLFRFYRGGVRTTIFSNSPSAMTVAQAHWNPDQESQSFNANSSSTFYNTTLGAGTVAMAMFPTMARSTVDFVTPYYSKFNCGFITVAPGDQPFLTDMSNTQAIVSDTVDSTALCFLSAADNTQFGFLMAPPMSNLTVPPPPTTTTVVAPEMEALRAASTPVQLFSVSTPQGSLAAALRKKREAK